MSDLLGLLAIAIHYFTGLVWPALTRRSAAVTTRPGRTTT